MKLFTGGRKYRDSRNWGNCWRWFFFVKKKKASKNVTQKLDNNHMRGNGQLSQLFSHHIWSFYLFLKTKATSWFVLRVREIRHSCFLIRSLPTLTDCGLMPLLLIDSGRPSRKVSHYFFCNSFSNILPRTASLDEEGNGLPHQLVPLRQICPQKLKKKKSELGHDLSRHKVQKWDWNARREPGNVLELGLLSRRLDCARARAHGYAWLQARAQSDTGVGRVLVCSNNILSLNR